MLCIVFFSFPGHSYLAKMVYYPAQEQLTSCTDKDQNNGQQLEESRYVNRFSTMDREVEELVLSRISTMDSTVSSQQRRAGLAPGTIPIYPIYISNILVWICGSSTYCMRRLLLPIC